jgi:hypothetical protein
VRYNVSYADYHDVDVTELMHVPALGFAANEHLSLLAEYVHWTRTSASTMTIASPSTALPKRDRWVFHSHPSEHHETNAWVILSQESRVPMTRWANRQTLPPRLESLVVAEQPRALCHLAQAVFHSLEALAPCGGVPPEIIGARGSFRLP